MDWHIPVPLGVLIKFVPIGQAVDGGKIQEPLYNLDPDGQFIGYGGGYWHTPLTTLELVGHTNLILSGYTHEPFTKLDPDGQVTWYDGG